MVFKLSQNIAPLLDIFVQSPQALAQGIVGGGAPSVMSAVDTIWNQGPKSEIRSSRGGVSSVRAAYRSSAAGSSAISALGSSPSTSPS